ncbi:hypothetical protein QYE76_021002 [Lolium multiflorum]|uniref:Arabidopsis retrotransposon Orf1 C-terminal domain-containing protein n=1 Tax=Lolium multiflorum TaxID=4521 RepID=A0AAD8VSF3_LOLMU|nr:hypothetical protein QYE76_021002 [Lolium multiflorum]
MAEEQITCKDLPAEHNKKYDELKAIREAELIGSFETTRSHNIKLKGNTCPSHGVNTVDLSHSIREPGFSFNVNMARLVNCHSADKAESSHSRGKDKEEAVPCDRPQDDDRRYLTEEEVRSTRYQRPLSVHLLDQYEQQYHRRRRYDVRWRISSVDASEGMSRLPTIEAQPKCKGKDKRSFSVQASGPLPPHNKRAESSQEEDFEESDGEEDRYHRPRWCPDGLSHSQKRRVQRLRNLEEAEAQYLYTLRRARPDLAVKIQQTLETKARPPKKRIYNFDQEDGEKLPEAWARFCSLIRAQPDHDLEKHDLLDIFYSGLTIESRAYLDSCAGCVFRKRTPDDAEELLAKIGRNHDDWSTPEPTPTPIVKKRGMIKLNDEDMREAKKSLKEKGIKPEDVKNLPPIEDICETIPPSSMIEDPLYPEGHPKRVEQDSQPIKTSAPSKKKKKKHKNVVESSEPVNDPNSISISDAETESGNEHEEDNDKNDTPDKEEIEKEPEKPAKNKKYTKEDFITEKHGNEREPWVQKQMPFPAKKLKSKEEEHYNKFCDWMKPLFLQIPLTDAIKLPPYSKYMKDIVTNKRKIPNEEISTMLANYSFNGKIPKKLGDPGIPTIPCSIKNNYVRTALCDLGAGVSVMPFSLYKRLDLDKLIPTDISLQMADKSTAIPVGLCENVPVQVTQHCLILTDFVVLEMPEDDNMSIILGRPFLNTAGAVIDCNKGMVTFNVDNKEHTVYFPKRIDKKGKMKKFKFGELFKKATTSTGRPSRASTQIRRSYNEDVIAPSFAPEEDHGAPNASSFPCYEFLTNAGLLDDFFTLVNRAGLATYVGDERGQYYRLTKIFVESFKFHNTEYEPTVAFKIYDIPVTMKLEEFCFALGIAPVGTARRIDDNPRDLLELYRGITGDDCRTIQRGKIRNIQLPAIKYFAYYIGTSILGRENTSNISSYHLAFLNVALTGETPYHLGSLIARRLSSRGPIFGGTIASRILTHLDIPLDSNDVPLTPRKLDIAAMKSHHFVTTNSTIDNIVYKMLFADGNEKEIPLPQQGLFNIDRQSWSLTKEVVEEHMKIQEFHQQHDSENVEPSYDYTVTYPDVSSSTYMEPGRSSSYYEDTTSWGPWE